MSPHVSVMREEAVAALSAAPGKRLVDATFGAGGYTEEMLRAGAEVIAFDRDPTAIRAGRERFAHDDLTLIEAPFGEMEEALTACGKMPVQGVVFDLGVSSMQIDQAARGFSFMREGPLDMRMGRGRPAADFVNEAEEKDLADVIYQYGEERRSRRLARMIVEERAKSPIETTAQLAAIAERALGTREKIHPATRLFQAVRILINDELGEVVRGLIAAERVLEEGGVLSVVSFHSLEDRIVKRFFDVAAGRTDGGSRHLPEARGRASTLEPVRRKAASPSAAEIAANPRARSAKLRAARRTGTPAGEWREDELRRLGAPPLTFSLLQRAWAS